MLRFVQVHLPVHLPCYDLPPFFFVMLNYVDKRIEFRESDGRCVRASYPVSARHSCSCLLLNPPSDVCFNTSFVVLLEENVANFMPLHGLHLDLTFLAVPILPTV